jgi:hypothetical protein
LDTRRRSPEISQVTFELSTNSGAIWTPLGNGIRVGTTADWQLSGLSLPATGLLRARGRTTCDGYIGSSSGVIESMAQFPIGPPVLLSPALTNGQFSFTLQGTTGAQYVVLASTNLVGTNWTSIRTGAAPFQLTDPTTNGMRFYRGRIAP